MKPRMPNLLFIILDEFRASALGHLGNKAACTPYMDALGTQEGVSFRNAFCQSPVCSPSRCSFMTGWYPHTRGHRTMNFLLQEEEPMLLRILKENGYYVWWGGKNDILPAQTDFRPYCNVRYKPARNPNSLEDLRPNWRGTAEEAGYYSFYFGETPGEGDYYSGDRDCVEAAAELLRDWSGEQPLCVCLTLTLPHPPYAASQKYMSRIAADEIAPLQPIPKGQKPKILQKLRLRQNLMEWPEEKWRELQRTYLAMCANADDYVGELLGVLKQAGCYDDTAVFIFSDHGDYAGDYGLVEKTQNTFEDALSNVPLIIKPPASIPWIGGIREQLVELVDVSATIYDLCGIEPQYTSFGKSLLPVIVDGEFLHKNAVFCEGGRLIGEAHCMEKDGGGGQSGGIYWPRLSLQKKEAGEHTKAVMCRTRTHKYVKRLYEPDELYDLEQDPGELDNVAEREEYTQVLQELKEVMLDFYVNTVDVVPYTIDTR